MSTDPGASTPPPSDPAHPRKLRRRPPPTTWQGRLIRYVMVALAALAVAQAVRTWQSGGREITLMYSGGAGEMAVRLLDEEGQTLRRVTFAPKAERRHTISLPDGSYRAIIDVAGARREAWFRVESGVSTVELPRR